MVCLIKSPQSYQSDNFFFVIYVFSYQRNAEVCKSDTDPFPKHLLSSLPSDFSCLFSVGKVVGTGAFSVVCQCDLEVKSEEKLSLSGCGIV
jgi:hypothetical protein